MRRRVMSGWIRLHRGWRECDVFTGEPASEREAWVHLIEIAAWKPMIRRAGKGDVINVGRGQLHTAERTLADMWSWDRKRVKRFLTRLEKYGMIRQESGPSGSLITICNYSEYQSDGTDDGAIHGTIQGPFEDHSRTTQEEGKERKEGKEKKKWVLPDWIDADAWADWEAQRKALKKPLTDHARKLHVGVLEKAQSEGFTVRETIDLAIASGWQGLFVPKGKPATTSRPNISWKDAQARVNELHFKMTDWNSLGRAAREAGNTAEWERYRDLYQRDKAEREALEKAFNIQSTWR